MIFLHCLLGGACSCMQRWEMHTKFLFRNLNSRDHCRDLSADGRINAEMDLTHLMPGPNLIAPPKISKSCFLVLTEVEFLNVMFLPKAILTKKYTYQWNALTSKYCMTLISKI